MWLAQLPTCDVMTPFQQATALRQNHSVQQPVLKLTVHYVFCRRDFPSTVFFILSLSPLSVTNAPLIGGSTAERWS